MVINVEDHAPFKTIDGTTLKNVEDFKYSGARMHNTLKYIKVRNAFSWIALHDLKQIWTVRLSNRLKLFHATIKTIPLCVCEARTITKAMTRSHNGCYTEVLLLDVSWRVHMTNSELYGSIAIV